MRPTSFPQIIAGTMRLALFGIVLLQLLNESSQKVQILLLFSAHFIVVIAKWMQLGQCLMYKPD